MRKNLHTIRCECGEVLNISNLAGKIEPCTIHNFYGGNVTDFGTLKCKCGRKYKGYLEANANTYDVIDMELLEDKKKKKEKEE